MQNEILINATPGETRVAILEKKQFVELHIERDKSKSVVGSVVKGRVLRVLPGMQASFVDIGLEKAAFLYAGDYVEDIEDLDEGENGGNRGRRRRNRNVPNIESLLSEGQEIMVQIAKEPIGTKGARITSHVSIAGRHLVLTPWAQKVGVSRKIDSDRERRRLRDIVNRVKPPDLGFIIRTAGEGTRDADLEADVKYLTTVWDDIQIKKDRVRAPAVLYEEPALPLRVIRDFANAETRRIVVDSPEAYAQMKAFLDQFVAEPKPRLEHYQGGDPALRRVRLRGADRLEPRPQGVAQVGRLPDRGPERGAHGDRREHRPLRGQARPRRDGAAHQPRGGARGREPAPLPQHRRAHHRRPDRHGVVREPREGLPRLPGGAARRQGQDEHPEDLRARARGDDAQAHAREPGADALRALPVLRAQGLRAVRGERGAQGAARDPEGPARASAGARWP